jgi:hypothetical protein
MYLEIGPIIFNVSSTYRVMYILVKTVSTWFMYIPAVTKAKLNLQ